jgi:dynein heavy chain, axonemal
MRAVMAVLRAAGNLKRRFQDEDEYVLMLRSIMDVNLCKFLSDDVPLFRGIVSDLFMGVELPKADYTLMERAMKETAAEMNLQPTEYFLSKTIQLYEMIVVRHGLMIVGHPFSAKTSSYKLLAGAPFDLPID